LSGELFKTMAGVDIIHVPYKGAGPAYNDLVAGTVQMMFANMPSMLPQVRGGKLKGLGVTSAERSKAAPDIPAIAETLPGYVATSWYGIGAPAGTPAAVVEKVRADVTKVFSDPALQQKLVGQGFVPVTDSTPAAFKAQIEREIPMWRDVVARQKLKFE
jgi:tripartite-type tricarboxylate transporter receptor subunit TctC